MSTITLDEVERLADRLTPLDQVRLIAYLSQQLAPVLSTPRVPAAPTAWERLEQLRGELTQLPATRLASEQLALDRAEHQAQIEGSSRVHP